MSVAGSLLAKLPPASFTNSNTEPASDTASALYGALGRTLTRALALYFARPVRLFRPSKVTGWMTLRSAAERHNSTLTPQYLSLLIRTEGWKILPRHFFPPLLLNSALGLVLFESFTFTNKQLHALFPDASNVGLASLSGACAGAAHAVCGAPADNVRIVLERGLGGAIVGSHSGWQQAWMEVFGYRAEISPAGTPVVEGIKSREEAQKLRAWIREVKGMGARGWDGAWWSVGKDSVGFAIFFAVFEVSRQLANLAAANISSYPVVPLSTSHLPSEDEKTFNYTEPGQKPGSQARIAHGIVLVSGGVAAGYGYELASRPFDNARRLLDLHLTTADVPAASSIKQPSQPPSTLLLRRIRSDGVLWLFRSVTSNGAGEISTVYRALRALGRLGPWGVGFLMWEGLAPDFSN